LSIITKSREKSKGKREGVIIPKNKESNKSMNKNIKNQQRNKLRRI